MILAMDEHDIEFSAGHSGLVKSVSQYDDFSSSSAKNALQDASQQLFPLADYIENNFVQGSFNVNDTPRQHHAEG